MVNKQLSHRNELPILLQSLGLNNIGVEIGVGKGAYSYAILLNNGLKLLYSVDNWDDSAIKAKAERTLDRFGDRNEILHTTSEEASKRFSNGSLDFVYIDADHTYESIKRDLELWYPKVKKGGIFAGHDYIDRVCKYGTFGVKSAVNEMVDKHKQELFITKEHWPSWFLIKI